jgi:hypothetical protein
MPQTLDKFYTNPDTSLMCISHVGRIYDWNKWALVVEPSAGNGSFYDQIPVDNKVGMDISPDGEGVVEMDFFDYVPDTEGSILFIGNPPFGKNSSLAVKFFQHAAKYGKCIAMILPRTFRRVSIQNKLSLNFHLVLDVDIPTSPCCFTPAMMAKCCFQVWEYRDTLRPIIKLPTEHADWKFLKLGSKDANGQPTPPEGADFALRAYGGKCGEIKTSKLASLRPKSWHWMKISGSLEVEDMVQRFKQLDYSVSQNTARQNSIGRADLVKLYDDTFKDK